MITRTDNPFGQVKDAINLIRNIEGNVSHAANSVHSLLAAAMCDELSALPKSEQVRLLSEALEALSQVTR